MNAGMRIPHAVATQASYICARRRCGGATGRRGAPNIIDCPDAEAVPWVCEACMMQYAYNTIDTENDGLRPVCPEYADRGVLPELRAADSEPAG